MSHRLVRPLPGLAIAAILSLSSCGGTGDNTGAESNGGEEAATQSEAAGGSDDTAPEAPDGFDVPENFTIVDGLISEVAGVPLPEPSLYLEGNPLLAPDDPRQTATQTVFTTLNQLQLAEFFFEQIPASELSIGTGVGSTSMADTPTDGRAIIIPVDRANGVEGVLVVNGGGSVSGSSVQIDFFYAGGR